MFHDDRSPEGPASAAGDSIILHVPSCVQRFSSRRRILSRLRALARRRSRVLPKPEEMPLKLTVEENLDWPDSEEPLDALLEGEEATDPESLEPVGAILSPEKERDLDASEVIARSEAVRRVVPAEPRQSMDERNTALIQQLVDENKDLKAALCRLIRISEQNHEALRLLEEENDELAALVHRLTIGQTRATPIDTNGGGSSSVPGWIPTWGAEWLQRRQARRCP